MQSCASPATTEATTFEGTIFEGTIEFTPSKGGSSTITTPSGTSTGTVILNGTFKPKKTTLFWYYLFGIFDFCLSLVVIVTAYLIFCYLFRWMHTHNQNTVSDFRRYVLSPFMAWKYNLPVCDTCYTRCFGSSQYEDYNAFMKCYSLLGKDVVGTCTLIPLSDLYDLYTNYSNIEVQFGRVISFLSLSIYLTAMIMLGLKCIQHGSLMKYLLSRDDKIV